jgi:ABC-type multidrug transport system fused ATPase/permease subunit
MAEPKILTEPPTAPSPDAPLPTDLFTYIYETTALHQLFLLLLSTSVFLIELVPLELQRRIVNDLVKHRAFGWVIELCAVYAGVVLVHGAAKLVLNIYRNWVGERAVRDLRRRLRRMVARFSAAGDLGDQRGIQISMITGEVEPIGGFVGASVSEPLLQGGVMLSVLAYLIHLEAGLAAAGFALFLPQLLFVPLMQRAINRRSAARIWMLRGLSASLVAREDEKSRRQRDESRIDLIFSVNMGIYRLKFSMNFLMNLCNHLQIVVGLLLGGWYVLHGELEVGGIVAYISGIGRLNDPWGDLVNYFRDASVNSVKYNLVIVGIHRLARETGVEIDTAATRG